MPLQSISCSRAYDIRNAILIGTEPDSLYDTEITDSVGNTIPEIIKRNYGRFTSERNVNRQYELVKYKLPVKMD